LSYYNQYTIKAKDFKSCVNEDCTNVCSEGIINCVKTECTEADIKGGICVVPVIPAITEESIVIGTEN
jgi:hypothetical protein